MAKGLQGIVNLASDLYHGAVKGVNKADDTVIKAMAKSNTSKNLKYAKGSRMNKNVQMPKRTVNKNISLQSMPKSKSSTAGAQFGN